MYIYPKLSIMSSLSEIHKSIEKLVEDRLRALASELDLDAERLLEANKRLSKDVSLKKKKNRDPNRPKQPDNSYLLFTRDCRAVINKQDVSSLFPKALKKTVEGVVDELKKESDDGSLSSKLFTKRLGALWKSKEMEKHKKAYEDEAAKRREQYKKDCQSYESSKTGESKPKKSAKASGKKSTKSTKKTVAKKSKGKSKKEEPEEPAEEVEENDEDEEVVDEE